MKSILLTITATLMLLGCNKNYENHNRDRGVLRIHNGVYAFCGASSAVPTGNKIIVQGVEYDEGCAICPVLDGPSIASLAMEGVSPSWAKVTGTDGEFNTKKDFEYPGNDGSTIWNEKYVWSYFWYFDSSDTIPQFNPDTKDWEWSAPVNRSFIINMDSAQTSESNMFAMPGVIFDTTSTGIVLAKVYGPLNEAAVPLRKAVPVKNGEKSVTAAKEGSPYPVGTPIPEGGESSECCSKEK